MEKKSNINEPKKLAAHYPLIKLKAIRCVY